MGPSYQHLDDTFNVPPDMVITRAEGCIGGGQGGLAMELHQGATPTGALLCSAGTTVTDVAEGWRGATGLSWSVAAGDYTLTPIFQPGFSGYMRDAPARPLGAEWMTNSLVLWAQININFGWRVGADAALVPEPAPPVLVLLGLLAVRAAIRRQRLA